MVLLMALQILNFLGSGLSVPAVSLGVKTLGGSGAWIGLAFSGVSLMRAWSLSITGYFLDRIARPRLFLIIGSIFYILASWVMATANHVIAIVGGRFLQGFSMAFYIPAVYVLTIWGGPSQRQTQRLSLLNLAFFMGFSIGPAIGGWLIERYGWRSPFWAMIGLGGIGLGLILWGLPSYRVGRSTTRSFGAALRHVIGDACVLGLFLLRLGIAFGRGIIMAFLPVLGVSRGLSVTEVGMLLTVQLVIMAFLQYPVGIGIDRYGFPRFSIIVGNSLVLIGLIGFLSGHRSTVFWIATILTGVGGGLAVPGALALMAERGRTLGLASTVSVLESAFAIGFAAGPMVGGILADMVGMAGTFGSAVGAGVLGLLAFVLTTRRTVRNREVCPS